MILDLLSWLMICTGCLIGIIGGIGMIRFPDFYSRIHAAGMTDTLCAALILSGLGLQSGWTFDSVKLFLIFAFLFFTSPTSSYSVGNWAWQCRIKPWVSPGRNTTAGSDHD